MFVPAILNILVLRFLSQSQNCLAGLLNLNDSPNIRQTTTTSHLDHLETESDTLATESIGLDMKLTRPLDNPLLFSSPKQCVFEPDDHILEKQVTTDRWKLMDNMVEKRKEEFF